MTQSVVTDRSGEAVGVRDKSTGAVVFTNPNIMKHVNKRESDIDSRKLLNRLEREVFILSGVVKDQQVQIDKLMCKFDEVD